MPLGSCVKRADLVEDVDKQRPGVGVGLTAAGLRNADHVAAAEGERQRLLRRGYLALDRRGPLEVLFLDLLHKLLVQVQLIESHHGIQRVSADHLDLHRLSSKG